MPISTKFLKSAFYPDDFPGTRLPEVAFAGRSNAGKSSFINLLAGCNIAKVSKTPGKTRLLNFFDIDEKYRWVDMPGYGFAVRSAEEKMSWQRVIETYLMERENLVGLILVMDIRRDWEEEEELLLNFLTERSLPFGLVLTKSDKLTPREKEKRLSSLQCQALVDNVFLVSSLKKLGGKEVESFIYNQWVKNWKRVVAKNEN